MKRRHSRNLSLPMATFQAYRRLTLKCVYSQQTFLYKGKRLRTDHPEEMPLIGGIVALCPCHGHLPGFRRLTILYVQAANVPIQRATAYRPLAFYSYCSCTLEWWDVRTPGTILNVFDFLDYTFFKFYFKFFSFVSQLRFAR